MTRIKRYKKSGRQSLKTVRPNRKFKHAGSPEATKKRRERYNSEEEFREQVKELNRIKYRKTHPKKDSKLRFGLLIRAERREVTSDTLDYPAVVEVYNHVEAAKALGLSSLALKKWIDGGIILPPILYGAVHNNRKYYSYGELKIIAGILVEHHKEYIYLLKTNTNTIDKIHQAINEYRETNI